MSDEQQMVPGIDYFAGVAKPAVDLKTISALAEKSTELQAEIDALMFEVEQKTQENDKILRKQLPELMKDAGLESFKLADGSTVGVKSDVKCGITQANAARAFAWLEEHEFGGIIKSKLVSEFGREELEEAQKAIDLLSEAGFQAELNRTVHPATLKSFVKERLEEGDDIPVDVFGIFEFEMAKITKPKATKSRK